MQNNCVICYNNLYDISINLKCSHKNICINCIHKIERKIKNEDKNYITYLNCPLCRSENILNSYELIDSKKFYLEFPKSKYIIIKYDKKEIYKINIEVINKNKATFYDYKQKLLFYLSNYIKDYLKNFENLIYDNVNFKFNEMSFKKNIDYGLSSHEINLKNEKCFISVNEIKFNLLNLKIIKANHRKILITYNQISLFEINLIYDENFNIIHNLNLLCAYLEEYLKKTFIIFDNNEMNLNDLNLKNLLNFQHEIIFNNQTCKYKIIHEICQIQIIENNIKIEDKQYKINKVEKHKNKITFFNDEKEYKYKLLNNINNIKQINKIKKIYKKFDNFYKFINEVKIIDFNNQKILFNHIEKTINVV